MANVPDADEIRARILDAISSYGVRANEVIPLGGLRAKLQQGGLQADEVDAGMSALQAEGMIEPAPGEGGLVKVTEKGFDAIT